MRDFRSCCRKHMIEAIRDPVSDKDIMKALHDFRVWGQNILVRRAPYTPSFSKTLARIIEPATGASTCALGSQRWRGYIGILIRKAAMRVRLWK